MTRPIRVLIADDHPLFRDGLIALLNEGPGTELAGAAASGAEAVGLARETQPDVVVMDLHMPGMNGIEAIRRIVADSPHITVLVLSMFDDDSIFSALRAGARGYLLKGADREQIRRGIHAAAHGEVIFGAHLATRMLACFTAAAAPRPAFPQLTEREREVLDWSPRAGPTRRSRPGCRSARRPYATTCRTSWPSCRWPTGPKRSCRPGTRAWDIVPHRAGHPPGWHRDSSRAPSGCRPVTAGHRRRTVAVLALISLISPRRNAGRLVSP
jgi:DNA-binding NarL/FixJ family response regulator